MQQFQVPQYIDIEGKILGPLTIRQTLIVVVAGGIVFLLRFVLEAYLLIPIGAVLGVSALALAFIKINGRPLLDFIASFFTYLLFPRLYIWKKKGIKREKEVYTKEKGDAEEKDIVKPSQEVTDERLRSYVKGQDTIE